MGSLSHNLTIITVKEDVLVVRVGYKARFLILTETIMDIEMKTLWARLAD